MDEYQLTDDQKEFIMQQYCDSEDVIDAIVCELNDYNRIYDIIPDEDTFRDWVAAIAGEYEHIKTISFIHATDVTGRVDEEETWRKIREEANIKTLVFGHLEAVFEDTDSPKIKRAIKRHYS